MITPRAFGQIIRHFDGVDKVIAARTMRKRPWSEIALTSLLCDLLDETTQEEEHLDYTFKQLQEDLNKEDSLFGINLALETIEFNPIYERYVSQSDIGLRFVFDDNIEFRDSWKKSFLLQAKRLFPKATNPLVYTEGSSFSSIDSGQQQRINILSRLLGASQLKYLLFCPRPDSVDNDTKIKLAYLRNKRLSGEIFDYTKGLELYRELTGNSETLKAGLFIADLEYDKLTFGKIHSQLLQGVFPFSWFIAMNFDGRYDLKSQAQDDENSNLRGQELVEGVLSGNKKIIEEIIEGMQEDRDIPTNIQILPKHTITIKVSVGGQIDQDRRG